MPDSQLVACLFDAVARQVHTSAASLDLAAGQWAILRHLDRHTQYGRTADDLAAYFSEPPANMGLTLASLMRKGLVTCDAPVANPNARYALTAAGDEKLDHDPVMYAARAIGTMSDMDRAEFSRLLEAILTALTQNE